MNLSDSLAIRFALLCGLVSSTALFGCQTNIGGQTLPSAYYLRDDVQYFPAGPETQLSNARRAHEEYRAAQELAEEGYLAVP